ncbi:hypothetical protein CLG_B0098 [Clostridium botulinum D str. 1873]|uniref:Uncharacterized protein n=1 Tax=Clostridium botulinum D str. 1873 TaxID=592027 RepID=A0A9P2LKG6_CLOBO|nr:hypothetical protein CLG_B0098 [Clostridium botulinum D str. 1873]
MFLYGLIFLQLSHQYHYIKKREKEKKAEEKQYNFIKYNKI